MAGQKTESGLEDAVKKWLKTLPGVFYFKAHGGQYQQPGLPDLIICWHGTFVAVELKKPGRISVPLLDGSFADRPYKPGSTTEILQVQHIEAITQAGGVAFIADDLEVIKQRLFLIDNLVSKG